MASQYLQFQAPGHSTPRNGTQGSEVEAEARGETRWPKAGNVIYVLLSCKVTLYMMTTATTFQMQHELTS